MFNSCNSWETCDFPCTENTFYGDDANCFYEPDIKPQQQQPQNSLNGLIYGRRLINEPAVNFNNGGFYNTQSPAAVTAPQPMVAYAACGAGLYNDCSSLEMSSPCSATRFHPYQRQGSDFGPYTTGYGQQSSMPYARPGLPLLNLPVPCRGNQPWGYEHCYGYGPSQPEPCQFSQFVDIEDFM